MEIRKEKTGLNKSQKAQSSRGLTRLLLFVLVFFSIHIITVAQEKGKASYYAQRLHGARMSDGTKYHRDSMTCAHKRYPLGTLLKVTNLSNGKSVVVKVTDRGPHTRGRIIDLSYAAAKQINMIAAGVVMVKVEPYKGEVSVPYRLEEKKEKVEFEFDFSKYIYDYTPEWQLKDKDKEVFSPQQREKMLSDEEKISQIKEEIHTPTNSTSSKKIEEHTEHVPHKASQRHRH